MRINEGERKIRIKQSLAVNIVSEREINRDLYSIKKQCTYVHYLGISIAHAADPKELPESTKPASLKLSSEDDLHLFTFSLP